MSTSFLALLTFSTVLIAGLMLMQPVFSQYIDAYAVRVRVRSSKRSPEEGAEQPRNSILLMLCRAQGELALSALPGLGDRQSVQLLQRGNYRTQAHLCIFIGVKSIAAVGCLLMGIIGVASNSMMLFLTPFFAVIGWLLPNFFLASRVKQRQKKILRELPTIIDLLIVCAQAGLSLMLAIDKVSKEVSDSCPVLAAEMQQLIQDVKIFARSAPVALQEMGERTGVDELISMASALIAAEQKGADISYPLKQQGEALRQRLKRQKEEEAAKVPVKMVPVIMIFIMPLIMAPMLGPAIVTIINVFGPIIN